MIYLISDDSYFTLGVEAILGSINNSLTPAYLNGEKEYIWKPEFTSDDILLIAVEHTEFISGLLEIARNHGTRILFIMDSILDDSITSPSLWSQSILSKKMPLDTLPKLLECEFTYLKDLSFLTRSEIKVMKALTKGQTPYKIASELNLSVKTIFTHKVNALKKLGLNHLNARSVLIFGKVCQGLSYF